MTDVLVYVYVQIAQEDERDQGQDHDHVIVVAGDQGEGEGEETTMDGSVDWNGSPCLRAKSGGWPAGLLILRKYSSIYIFFLRLDSSQFRKYSYLISTNYMFLLL